MEQEANALLLEAVASNQMAASKQYEVPKVELGNKLQAWQSNISVDSPVALHSFKGVPGVENILENILQGGRKLVIATLFPEEVAAKSSQKFKIEDKFYDMCKSSVMCMCCSRAD